MRVHNKKQNVFTELYQKFLSFYITKCFKKKRSEILRDDTLEKNTALWTWDVPPLPHLPSKSSFIFKTQPPRVS